MNKMFRALSLLSVSALFALGALSADRAETTAPIAQMEHIEFEEPAYLIVDQVDDAPMATGALKVEKVEFEQPLEVSIHRTVPGV